MKFELDMLDLGNADSFMIRYFGDDEKEIVILVHSTLGNKNRTVHELEVFKWTQI